MIFPSSDETLILTPFVSAGAVTSGFSGDKNDAATVVATVAVVFSFCVVAFVGVVGETFEFSMMHGGCG